MRLSMRQAPDENGGEIKGSTIFLKKEINFSSIYIEIIFLSE
jgi:hypothetical protein